MKSKFTLLYYLLTLLIVVFVYITISLIPKLFSDPDYDGIIFPKIFLPAIVIFTLFFLIMGELKNKCTELYLENNEVRVKRFWGLQERIIKNSEIDGWKLSHQIYNHKQREFILIIKNNKTVAIISQPYHKNYFEIKLQIADKFKYIGYEKFSYIKDFKKMLIWH